ncbi:hypothetical protein [Methylocella sp.]|uniref:hypothetical protein n=1 Tax=Methylocella sp. TaxID=1978226 RepID=UPI0035B1C89A
MSPLTEERFWLAAVATLTVGARLANQLGFAAIDELALRRFLHTEWTRMRQDLSLAPNDLTKATNVIALLGQFLGEQRAEHTLVTDVLASGASAPAVKVFHEHTLDRLKTITVRIAKQTKHVRIAKGAFDDWLTKRGMPVPAFTSAATKLLHMRSGLDFMGAGTRYATATEPIYTIAAAGTVLEKHIAF